MKIKFNDNPFNKIGYGNWGYYRERAAEKGLSPSDRIKRCALLVLASIPLINILVSGIEWASRRFKKLEPKETPTVEKTDEQRKRLLDSISMVPSVETQKTPLQLLEEDLQSWIDNPEATGEKVAAAGEIRNAFYSGATKLDLSYMYLNLLPDCIGSLTELQKLEINKNNLTFLPESIGRLTQLQHLILCSNQLTSLPDWIGELTQLRELALPRNQLKELPESIGNSTQLQYLQLNDNELAFLPRSIGNLTRLGFLDLRFNTLRSLPESIGNLNNLEAFSLSANQLKELPRSMGDLISLRALEIDGNAFLNSLPISLGHISGLTELNIEGTQIPLHQRDAILEQCKALRQQSAHLELPLRLNTWKAASRTEIHLEPLLEFTDTEKGHINEWLLRLERAKDFSGSTQFELAKTVVGILASLIENNEFKKDFLVQICVNEEGCGDRAAMALNELYTAWKIACLPHNASKKDTLILVERAAKTSALRNAIANAIAAEKQKTGNDEGEAVEIYLYYEMTLKNQLNLLSAIETMSYGRIGQRDWIDQNALIKSVNKTYLDALVSLDIFEKLCSKDSGFNEKWDPLDEEYQEKLMAMHEKLLPLSSENKTSPSEKLYAQILDLEAQIGDLEKERLTKKREIAKAWYQEQR